MNLTYTITAIEGGLVTVEFSDGSWAEIFIGDPNITIPQFEALVYDYAPKEQTEDAVDVQSLLGLRLNEERPVLTSTQTYEELAYLEKERRDEFDKKEMLTYAEMRARSYPTVGDQLDALYKSRAGDMSELEMIDSHITEVKETYPKDTPPMSAYDFNKQLEGVMDL